MTARAQLEFTVALQDVLAPTGNMVWSPFSVASALALAARGASGVTRAELVALLLGDKQSGNEAAEVEDLITLLGAAERLVKPDSHQEPPVLQVANTLWADESIGIRPQFGTALERMPSGAVRLAPFQQEPEKARQLINEDVAKTTRNLIPELLPSGVIRDDTVAALVNALYLKAAWLHRFEESATEARPFHTPAGQVSVPTMWLSESLGYARTSGWQVIAMPAVGGIEAVVLLPDGDLPNVDAGTLEQLLAAPARRKVSLRMPKLKLKLQAELTPALNQLGVRTAFSNAADFSELSDHDLAIQAVLHESVLKVDEQGFEGAAATAVMFRTLSMETTRPLDVTVDRPFLLLVRHRETGLVYFSARVTDPS